MTHDERMASAAAMRAECEAATAKNIAKVTRDSLERISAEITTLNQDTVERQAARVRTRKAIANAAGVCYFEEDGSYYVPQSLRCEPEPPWWFMPYALACAAWDGLRFCGRSMQTRRFWRQAWKLAVGITIAACAWWTFCGVIVLGGGQ